jgi:hypothetical protein
VWFWIWAVLILGWLTCTFLLLRWLWRQAVALMEAVSAATEAAGRALDGEGAWAATPLPPVAIFAGAADLRGRLRERAARIAGRRARRRARHQAAYDSWAVLAGFRDA